MSLLAGIKFVPKGQRDTSESKKRAVPSSSSKEKKPRTEYSATTEEEDRVAWMGASFDDLPTTQKESRAERNKKKPQPQLREFPVGLYDPKKHKEPAAAAEDAVPPAENSASADDLFASLLADVRGNDDSAPTVPLDDVQERDYDPEPRHQLQPMTYKSAFPQPSILSRVQAKEEEEDYSRKSEPVEDETQDNQSAAAKLRSMLLAGKKLGAPKPKTVQEVVVVQAVGRNSQGQIQREDLKNGHKRGKLKDKRSDQEVNVQALLAREKADRDNMDAAFARNIVRLGANFKGTELSGGHSAGMDEEDQIDTRMFEQADERMTTQRAMEMQIKKSINDERRHRERIQNCRYCMESNHFAREVVISQGQYVYLRLKTWGALADGHCEIVPIAHTNSTLQADEEVWTEIDRYKGCLKAMFARDDECVIFTEMAAKLHQHPHTRIECIPVPKEVDEDAPLFFRQALLEADETWSTHEKIIDLSKKPLRSAIPPNFPYFMVEWEGGGYAHVIEDADKFPRELGLDVLAGMLGADPLRFDSRGNKRKESRNKDLEAEKIRKFKDNFSTYDWTEYIGTSASADSVTH